MLPSSQPTSLPPGEPGVRRTRITSGLTLIEISISLGILLTILLGFSTALMKSMRASQANRERMLATNAARQMLETMQASEFSNIFRNYNSVEGDDLPGAPLHLSAFSVEGLDPRSGDADGLCGEIIFPELVTGTGVSQLRENSTNSNLGMPRDLNGDGNIDSLNHSGDYRILPVAIRVDWRGQAGNGQVQFRTFLFDF